MKTLKQQFNSAASGAIVHLRGRERALEGFGWAGRQAEWIALACLHGGVFTRAQRTSFLGCHHEKVRRAVRALVAQGVAVEEDPPGIDGIGRVCRIHVAVAATRPPVPHWAAPTWRGATPQSEGLVRVRTQVCFHTPAPVPWGRSRSINPYAGRRFERRFEAADHPFADRPAVWQPGITEQGRGTPDGSGHSPSRQVRDAPVPGDRWPSRLRGTITSI